jgi:Tol biopolymer transport system component
MSKHHQNKLFISLVVLLVVSSIVGLGYVYRKNRYNSINIDRNGIHLVGKCHSVNELQYPFKEFIGTTGWVKDDLTNEPISGASVEILGATMHTNDMGEFSIPKHDPCLDITDIAINAQGYLPVRQYVISFFPEFRLTQENSPATSNFLDGRAYFLSSSLDGRRRIYTIKYDGSDRQPVLLDSIPGEQYDLHVSPRDKYLAYLSTENSKADEFGQDIPGLYLTKVDGSTSQLLTSEKEIQAIAWSPDGTYLAWIEAVDSKKILSIYNLLDKKVSHFNTDEGDVDSFDFSNDDKLLAIGVLKAEGDASSNSFIETSSIWLSDGTANNPTKIIPTHSYRQTEPRFVASNNIEFNNAGTSYLYSTTAKKITNTHITFDSTKDPLISPDKHKIAHIATRDGQTYIIVSNPDGSSEGQLGVDSYSYDLHWTQDSQHILFKSSSQLWIEAITTPTDLRTITGIAE